MLGGDGVHPAREELGVVHQLVDGDSGDDGVEQKVYADQDDGDADGLLEAAEEDGAEDREQKKGDEHLAREPVWGEGVVDEMSGGVGGRERHGDDEVSGREA